MTSAPTKAPRSTEAEDIEQNFDAIEKFQQAGINIQDIKKLKDAGICTIISLSLQKYFIFLDENFVIGKNQIIYIQNLIVQC
jgi:hypothetical protein